jgi:ADP-heptose:LPS heptosyltransferase
MRRQTKRIGRRSQKTRYELCCTASRSIMLTGVQKKLGETTATTPDEEARVFALQRTFYQQRLDKKRNAEIAKRNRERLQNPNLFPQVPKGIP